MNRKSLLSLLVLLLLAGGFLWWRRPPSEERVVAQRVASLAERLSKNAGEGNSTMALKMTALSGMFADPVAVEIRDINFRSTYSASEMTSHIARYRAMLSSLALDFHDIRVVLEGPGEAGATFTARARFDPRDGQSRTETREIHARLRKVDGTWVFASFREETVLTR